MVDPVAADPRRRACDELAGALRLRLAEQGMSQAQLARAVGTHRDNISGYCAGRNFPRGALLARIALALGCRVEDLVPSLAGPARDAAAPEPGRFSAALTPDGTALVQIDLRVPAEVAAQLLALVAPYAAGPR